MENFNLVICLQFTKINAVNCSVYMVMHENFQWDRLGQQSITYKKLYLQTTNQFLTAAAVLKFITKMIKCSTTELRGYSQVHY